MTTSTAVGKQLTRAGRVAVPRICGDTGNGSCVSAVPSRSICWIMNPARSIVVAVSRPQWQPPVRNGKTLADRLAELPDGAEIVAYCRGRYCLMSVEAVRLLRARGYNVRPLDGGMIE